MIRGLTTEMAVTTSRVVLKTPTGSISGKVTLGAKKLALRVGFSAELAEDSLVPVLSMYREQAMRALAAAIDSVLLNGDTETGATGNINSDDGAPAATPTYLAFDGLRKLPLVTTTANGVSAGGDRGMGGCRDNGR